MSGTSSSLPDLHQLDSDALRTLILSQHEQILLKDEQLASRDAEIEQLKLLIAKLRRMQFGRKSEKVERQIEQLQLRLDELEASRAERALLLLRLKHIVRRNQCGGRCRNTCRARRGRFCRSKLYVRTAAES